MKDIVVRTITNSSLIEFLEEHNFVVSEVADGIYKVEKEDEMPVFVTVSGGNIFFQIDLGEIETIGTKELYFKLLDLNTEILPVSLGIDTTNDEDTRLVLVESREICNLDDNEILGVFNAMQLATDKVEMLLSDFLS